MDNQGFDRLVRRVELLTSRRATLGALAGAGLLAALGGPRPETEAKRKKKKKNRCKPKSLAVTCAGKCGGVTNNCKKAVDCPDCPFCQRCDAGSCEPDPAKVGSQCDGGGTVCVANGSCADCGFLDAPCCSSRNCVPSPGFGCFGDGVGICERCGDDGEQCCPNNICEVGRVCLSGTCEDCGSFGLPCCAGNACSGGSTCSGGQCV